MKFVPMHDLESPRLILRRFRPEDLDGHYTHITSDPEVFKTMLSSSRPGRDHAQQVLDRILSRYEDPYYYYWAIVRKEDDAYLGTIALQRIDEETGAGSFAYMLGRAFWNRGYMTEALKAVLAFAFDELELARIEADHFASNPASGAVMAKAGLRCLGTTPGKYEKDGIYLDAVSYAIAREDWLEVT